MPTSDPRVRNPGQLNDLVGRIAAKTLSPVDLVQGYLNRISEVDGQVMAWTKVDGKPRYIWPVSTGRRGHATPTGSFRPFRLEKEHYSKEWDDAPMP